MLIGDSVTYDGKSYVIVGFTPIAVRPALIDLRDAHTGQTITVEASLLRQAPERAALRVVRAKDRSEPRR